MKLRIRGYQVDSAASGERALSLAAARHPDAVILDLGLPGIDGVEVIRGLRGWTDIPILVLSVRDGEASKVGALDAGADDYVTKPFGMDELLARLRAALRRGRARTDEAPAVETAGFTIDLVATQARIGDREVRLTPTEWGLVEALVRNEGKLVTGRQLLHEVWAPATTTTSTTCASTWPRSAASWSPTPPTPATSSPSPAWATASCADREDGIPPPGVGTGPVSREAWSARCCRATGAPWSPCRNVPMPRRLHMAG